MNNSQLINQDSGKFEYYTPTFIIELARTVMGGIDLDPASSEGGNVRVKADRYFTVNDNGLEQAWFGKAWMNHPFSRANNPLWINKLVWHFREHQLEHACCITYAATSEKWFQPLMDYPQCYLSPRTDYYLPDGTKKRGVTKGSVVTYLGPNTNKFRDAFRAHGAIKIRI